MRYFITFVLTVLVEITSSKVFAQKKTFKTIHLNKYIALSNSDSAKVQALTVWDEYLQDKSSEHWSNEEKNYFGNDCDVRYRYIDYNFDQNEYNSYKPLILSVSKINACFLIKTAFYSIDKISNTTFITDIIDVVAVKEGSNMRLQSALYNNLKKLTKTEEGSIIVYSGKEQKIELNFVTKLDSINRAVSNIYKTDLVKVHYFLNPTINSYLRLIGYDYERTMYLANKKGNLKEGALSEMQNHIIYNGTSDPLINFTHEVTHLYTYQVFSPNNFDRTYHNFIDEGVSTFLGGTVGMSIPHLCRSLGKDIANQKYNYNFSNLLDNNVGVGEEDANLTYVVAGLICQLACEKEGMNGVFKLLRSGWTDEDLYKGIEIVLGVKRENLDSFVRNELKKYAN